MISQTLKATPQGIVTGGSLKFDFDETTGILTVTEQIFHGLLVFSQEIRESGVFKLDPAALLSKNLKIGASVSVGSVSLNVDSLTETTAGLSVTINDPAHALSLTGNAVLDLTGQYLNIQSLTVSGTIGGQQAVLALGAS